MNKKTPKKKKKMQAKTFSFGFNNTISLSITIMMVIIVSIVIAVMFVYTRDNMKGMQNNLTTNFISSVRIFNEDIQEGRFENIRDDLNSVLSQEYNVQDVIVTDKNMQELYSSLPQGAKYIYRILENPSSFKLVHSPAYDVNKYKAIYVGTENNNVYIIVSQDSEASLGEITNFVKWFFAGILILSLLGAYLLSRSISKPLSTMEETVSKVANGDLSGRLDYTNYFEINQLVQSYNMMINALQRLYSSLEAQVQDRTKELKSAYAELQNTQAMMVHSEKMKSLGELVAGIMHEINNPINFIYGNMTYLSDYSNGLIDIVEEYTKYNSSLPTEALQGVDKIKQEIDYEFLKTDMPDLIRSCKEGANRAKNIIQDLKSFSRMEEVSIVDVDIPHEIDTTLNILHNKLKNKAEIHKEYTEDVPKIEAFGGQLNQVFMNIIDNAVGAIKEKGDIWIRINTDKDKKNLILEIEDNGAGMDEETTRKVFNPFFTTKPVGQGTGLGLSITYKIIKNHQGTIKVESQEGMGTKFIITLPINIDRENLNASMISGGNNG